jgi:hypothetical protein
MNKTKRSNSKKRAGFVVASGVGACFAAAPGLAQDAGKNLTGTVAADPTPYYLGVSQGLTHDSNVYRIPSGSGDNYSSTSVFGGFDQPISRQRVFGRAGVSLNRYQDETRLNNTSYDLSAGAALETIGKLSGNVNLGLSRYLASPAATFGAPLAVRNVATTERIDSRVRWGGASILTLEGALGYSKVDYSAPEFVSSESRRTTGSLALYYRPGEFLRLGVAGRIGRSRTPSALLDPVAGTYEPNTVNTRNADLLADYTLSSVLLTNARLSYTRQSNSNIAGADFSGLTGSLAVRWQPTAKVALKLETSRDAGFENTTTTRYTAVQSGTGLVLTPVSAFDQNNRVTNSVALHATYEATAKVSATADLHYSRARLVSAFAMTAGAPDEFVDVSQGAALGVSYAITRAWGASCKLAHDTREVSGRITYSYKVNTVGCATQFVWR